MVYSVQRNNIQTMAQTGKISLKLKSQTPKTEQEVFNALAERLVKGEITATQASEEFKAIMEKKEETLANVGQLLCEAVAKGMRLEEENKRLNEKVALKKKVVETLKEENEQVLKELATLRRVSEMLYAKRQEENMELEARNDFIIEELLTDDQVEELKRRDKEAEEEEIRDTRRTEFLKWQMNLMKDYQAGKFTHAEGMRMMKEKYPEFYPDSDDEEDEEDEEEDSYDCVVCKKHLYISEMAKCEERELCAECCVGENRRGCPCLVCVANN